MSCKLQILHKLWLKEWNAMQMKAMTAKDKKSKEFVRELSAIKDEVKA